MLITHRQERQGQTKELVTYECDRDSVLQGRNCCPLPCPFLSSTVLDLWEEVLAITVFEFENIGCDFNQERVQLCLIPFLKYLEEEEKCRRYVRKTDFMYIQQVYPCPAASLNSRQPPS